jgi:mannose-1-phosphate guanylyltransferase
MQPAIRRWLGRTIPKQYCRFIGTRSLFQHTLDRTMQLTSPARTVVVVGRGHHEAWAQIGPREPGMVLVQPGNADTAPGIFLPLTYIRARDPEGTVMISPSDHFVFPEERFLTEVLYAIRAAEKLATRVVLLVIRPEGPEADYGWIRPGHELDSLGTRPVRAVKTFLENPEPALAKLAHASGALWNTSLMAGKVETFWNLGRRVQPKMMALFERLGDAIDTPKEPEILRAIYGSMPRLNFSRDLLAHVPGETAVMEMKGIWWSDWGSPERIVETLTRLGAGSMPVAMHCKIAAAEARSGRLMLRDEEDEEQVV